MQLWHICKSVAWRQAQTEGAYRPESLATEQFIHCSTREQYVATANRYYAGERDMVLLEIDSEKVAAPLRFENTSGGTELFPHIYGALNLDAVLNVIPFLPDADGVFSAPDA